MTSKERYIIFAYARNDMNALKTAKNISCHRNAVEYHLVKIEEKYGLNPKKFYDLVKLVEMAKGSAE